ADSAALRTTRPLRAPRPELPRTAPRCPTRRDARAACGTISRSPVQGIFAIQPRVPVGRSDRADDDRRAVIMGSGPVWVVRRWWGRHGGYATSPNAHGASHARLRD